MGYAYSEFTPSLYDRYMFGLKQWILLKYRNVCNNYNLECDSIYMDEEYQYTIVESLTPSKDTLQQQMIMAIDLCLLYPRESPSETTTIDEDTTEFPTEEVTNLIDIDTSIEVDEPTLLIEEDSSSDEEVYVDDDVNIDDVESSIFEDEDNTTITITKTRVITYSTVSN